jgi:hypothetical protein
MPAMALSLWQPFASAMFTYEQEAGVDRPIKAIETRHWEIKVPKGGVELWIHAAKKKYDRADYPEKFTRLVSGLYLDGPFMPYGVFLGSVWLTACTKADALVNAIGDLEREFGNYVNEDDYGKFQQRYGFDTDPFRIKILRYPYPYAGKQGIFYWTPPAGLEFKTR